MAAAEDDGKAFELCPSDKGIDFGIIDHADLASLNIPHGPIRLQCGYPGNTGFGHRHVAGYGDRVKQIQGLGYSSVIAFCEAIAKNYTKIGKARDGRLVVVHSTPANDLQLILQWVAEKKFWTIVTAVPARVARKFDLLCDVVRTGESEPTPDVAIRPRFATLSLPEKAISGGNGS